LDPNRTLKNTDNEIRISSINAMHVANYFIKKRRVPAEQVLAGMDLDLNFLKNTSNWLTNIDTFRLYYNCHRSVKNFTHHDWKAVGEEVYGKGAPGFFKVMFKIMPIDALFQNLPKYIPSVAKWCGYETISSKKGEIIYKCEAADRAARDRYSIGCECNYHLGILSSMPRLKDDYDYICNTGHEICSMPMNVIAEGCYGLKPEEYYYDAEGFHIRNILVARWARLKPRQDNEKYLGRSYELCTEDGSNALAVVRDFKLGDAGIFFEGEIYEAPYCVFKVSYRKRFFIGEKMTNKQMVIFLEKNLQMTEEKFRQATEAKKELEKTLEEVNKRDEIIKIYMRNSILDEIYAGGNPLDFQPKRKSVAILFSDIRDFAAITEELDPIALTRFLNNYFNMMSSPINDNSGEIDKYIGDAIMAVFPEPSDAIRAAIEMNRLLKQDGTGLLPGMGFEFRMGIGINYDEVVEGNIGTAGTKMDRTIIGDGVNLASRLESLTKYYHSEIIVSDIMREELDDSFELRYLDLITVKGKQRPVEIYEVLNGQEPVVAAFKKSTMKEYKSAVGLYKAGDFAKALKAFMSLNAELDSCRKKDGICHDPMPDIYISRLVDLIKMSDDRNFMMSWHGVYRHGEK
jgi:class 3 adenylate cyclase